MKPEEKEIEKIRSAFSKADSLLEKLEEKLKARVLCFICHMSITHSVVYRLNKIIRKFPKEVETLAVLIDSGGGDIDAASKMVKLLRSYCKTYISIIPFFAKSAATLLAVSADKVIMCRGAELGIVDPLVRDPITGIFIPASSLEEAINFIRERKDPLIKLSLADKIPPFLMGAYREAREISRQYLEEAFKKLKKKDEAIYTFTKKYISHGYPIDREQCRKIIPVEYPEKDLEDTIYDLYEIYTDLWMDLDEKVKDKEKKGQHLIIHAREGKCVIIAGQDISNLLLEESEE